MKSNYQRHGDLDLDIKTTGQKQIVCSMNKIRLNSFLSLPVTTFGVCVGGGGGGILSSFSLLLMRTCIQTYTLCTLYLSFSRDNDLATIKMQ